MPIRSGAMQRPSGCRWGNTLRQRYDEVGLPCSSTMGSPSPTSTYAISVPRTRRRCFWKRHSPADVSRLISVLMVGSMNTFRAIFLYSLFVPAHEGVRYGGARSDICTRSRTVRIFVLSSPPSTLEMGSLHYPLLLPIDKTLIHTARRPDCRTRFRT